MNIIQRRKYKKELNKIIESDKLILNTFKSSVIKVSKDCGLTAASVGFITSIGNEGKLKNNSESNYSQSINGIIDLIVNSAKKQSEILKQENIPFIIWEQTVSTVLENLIIGRKKAFEKDMLSK